MTGIGGWRVCAGAVGQLASTIDTLRATRASFPVTIGRMGAIAIVRSVNRATLEEVSKAPPPLSLRLGRAGTRALEDLAQLRGVSKAEAARQAIEEAAAREKRRSGLAAEVRRLMSDPAYVAEANEIVELMEELSGPG